MEFHSVASIFPLLEGEEYQALVEDIRQNGQIEPIWVYQGKIIDGRNRYRACRELGIEPKYREWDGEGSLVQFVVSLNLHRRHLTSSQKAVVAIDILPMLEAEARDRQRKAGGDKKSEGYKAESLEQKIAQAIFDTSKSRTAQSRDVAAEYTGTNRQYVSDAKKIAEQAPEVLEKVREGILTIPDAKKVAALPEETRQKVIKKIETKESKDINHLISDARKEVIIASILEISDEINDRYKLIHGDIAEAMKQIEDNSIDIIITDPPYPKEYLPVYEILAKEAARILKPGGSLLVMVGQSYLPEIIAIMSPYIQYHWMISYLTPGGQSVQLWQRKVNTFWKPILWFVKGEYSGGWIGDVTRSAVNDNDKRFHRWGQSESGMADIVERFTLPGQTILDPFVGGGTTAVVAVEMGRIFIGIDKDEDALKMTVSRLRGETKCPK